MIVKISVILILTFFINCICASIEPEKLTGEALVDYINSLDTTWTATKNSKFNDLTERVRWGMMGVNHVGQSIKGRRRLSNTRFLDVDIPGQFDSRTQWPQCPSLHNIRDQSACGSCWAFGAVEAMSDRICIASGGRVKVTLSADDLLACCTACGNGCDGGDPLEAWNFWVDEGIVTGSNNTAHSGCRPYPFPPCEHHNNKTHFPPCHHQLYPTPQCQKSCQHSYTQHNYHDDKHYGRKAYGIEDDVLAIQKEIMTHGPVEVAFEVYEDFLNYKGGIYQHKGGKLGGGHAVKMIGWGEQGGTPFWIVANSWNRDWGENGFFRIVRGINECGIESGVVAGIPKLNQTKRRQNHHLKHKKTQPVDQQDFFF